MDGLWWIRWAWGASGEWCLEISQSVRLVLLATHKQVVVHHQKSRVWKEMFSMKHSSTLPLWFSAQHMGAWCSHVTEVWPNLTFIHIFLVASIWYKFGYCYMSDFVYLVYISIWSYGTSFSMDVLYTGKLIFEFLTNWISFFSFSRKNTEAGYCYTCSRWKYFCR